MLGRTCREQGERHTGAHAEGAERHMFGRVPRRQEESARWRALRHMLGAHWSASVQALSLIHISEPTRLALI
eukprot:2960217-Alexandrium_andersonii.AAC.1